MAAAPVAQDGLDPTHGGVICLVGNANWYPRVLARLVATATAERGIVVVWHYEPVGAR